MKFSKRDITDREFEAFKTGDAFIFRLVFDRYHVSLYRYVVGITKNEEEAEDIVQESFIKLFEYKDKLDGAHGIYPFLFTLSKRLVLQNFRRNMVRMRYDVHLKQGWYDYSDDTQRQVELNDLQRTLTLAIDSLPEKQREIYQMHKLFEYTYQEIAERMGVSIHTIKNQFITASRKVKLQIEKYYILFFFFFLI